MRDHFNAEWSMFRQSYIHSSPEEGCLVQPEVAQMLPELSWLVVKNNLVKGGKGIFGRGNSMAKAETRERVLY